MADSDSARTYTTMADSDSAQTRKLSDDDSAFARVINFLTILRRFFQRKSSEVARDIEVKYDWTGTIGQWKLSEQRTPNYNDVLTVSHTPYGWDISLNVAPFKPNEIHVRIKPRKISIFQTYILKNELIVDCRHENRNDEIGSLSREMQRVIKIPGDVQLPSIAIFMYPSGLLTIKGTKGINLNQQFLFL